MQEDKQSNDVKPKNGDGAAEGANVIHHPKKTQEELNLHKPWKEKLAISKGAGNNSQTMHKCRGLNKETLSAINRAHTDQCKQEITNIACKQKAGLLYPSHIPRFCPLQGKTVLKKLIVTKYYVYWSHFVK